MQYERFSKDNIKDFRTDLTKLLEILSDNYGISATIGQMNYDASTVKMQITCAIGDGEEVERREFEKNCMRYGFQTSDYNRRVDYGGKHYRFVGFSTKARKYCFVLKDEETDEKIRFSQVHRYFAS